jgi:excisionase family DNA binding protein
MKQILFQGIDLSEFKNLISEVFDEKLKDHQHREPASNKPNLLSRSEVARMLRVSLATLNDWSKRGLIQSYRIGNRILYKQEEIVCALEAVRNQKHKRR